VSEHAAFGAVPPQLSGAAQAIVDATYRQPWASVLHVSTVSLFPGSHTVPLAVQGLAMHVHDAPASPVEQV